MLHLIGEGTAHTCDGLTRRDFLQAGALGAIGLSLADYAALKAAGAVSKDADERSVIMIFNLGAASQLDIVRHEARGAGRNPRPVQADPHRRRPAFGSREILPLHAKLADKFSLVRSCYHTAAAVHDTGHQMMQTGRLFTGGINTPHAGCVSELSARPADRSAGPRAACPSRWADRRQHAARAGRRLSGQGVRSVRAERRSVAAELSSSRPAAAAKKSAKSGWTAAASCATIVDADGRAISRRARTRSCWTAISRRRSGMMTSAQARAAFDLSTRAASRSASATAATASASAACWPGG